MAILALNSGSTSLKFGPYGNDGTAVLAEGEAGGNRLAERDLLPLPAKRKQSRSRRGNALRTIADGLNARGLEPVSAIGHRIVHGGPHLVAHPDADRCRVEDDRRRDSLCAAPYPRGRSPRESGTGAVPSCAGVCLLRHRVAPDNAQPRSYLSLAPRVPGSGAAALRLFTDCPSNQWCMP